MSAFEDKYEIIEQYLRGELSEVEKLSFDIEMSRNPELKAEFELQEACFSTLELAYASDLKSMISDYRSSVKKKPIYEKTSFKVLSALGLITMGLFATYYYTKPESKAVDEKIKPSSTHEQRQTEKPIQEVVETLPIEAIKDPMKESVQPKDEKLQPLEVKSTIKKELLDEVKVKELKDTSSTDLTETNIDVPVITSSATIVKQESPEQTKQETVVDCSIKPKVEVTLNHIYLGQSGQGSISLYSARDLEFRLNKAKFESVNNYTGLDEGKYKLQAKDSKECIYDFGEVTIKSIPCTEKKSYVFNLSSMQNIAFPVKDNYTKVTVFDQSGLEIVGLNSEFNQSVKWDGVDASGRQVNAGIYKVIIQSDDNKCSYNVVVAK